MKREFEKEVISAGKADPPADPLAKKPRRYRKSKLDLGIYQVDHKTFEWLAKEKGLRKMQYIDYFLLNNLRTINYQMELIPIKKSRKSHLED